MLHVHLHRRGQSKDSKLNYTRCTVKRRVAHTLPSLTIPHSCPAAHCLALVRARCFPSPPQRTSSETPPLHPRRYAWPRSLRARHARTNARKPP